MASVPHEFSYNKWVCETTWEQLDLMLNWNMAAQRKKTRVLDSSDKNVSLKERREYDDTMAEGDNLPSDEESSESESDMDDEDEVTYEEVCQYHIIYFKTIFSYYY